MTQVGPAPRVVGGKALLRDPGIDQVCPPAIFSLSPRAPSPWRLSIGPTPTQCSRSCPLEGLSGLALGLPSSQRHLPFLTPACCPASPGGCVWVMMSPALSELWIYHLLAPQFSSVQLLSHVQILATPWTAARRASLSITSSRGSLILRSMESCLQRIVGCDAIQTSHPLSSSSPTLNLSQHQGLFQ